LEALASTTGLAETMSAQSIQTEDLLFNSDPSLHLSVKL